jgi:hypothetical protein
MPYIDLPGSAFKRGFRLSRAAANRPYREWTDEGPQQPSMDAGYSPVDEKRAKREAAIVVQRWYRRQLLKFATFGPVIFTRRDGKLADFGSLSFLGGTRIAYYIRISDTTSSAMLSHFLEKYWRLPRPDVLISVTGSAASLQLTSQLQRVFDRGLASAAAMTNAWIFTGGTDSGVMKLVGEAMHKYGLVDVPVVGVAPWGAIAGRKELSDKKGQTIEVMAWQYECASACASECASECVQWPASSGDVRQDRDGHCRPPQPLPHASDPRGRAGRRERGHRLGLGDWAEIAPRAHVRNHSDRWPLMPSDCLPHQARRSRLERTYAISKGVPCDRWPLMTSDCLPHQARRSRLERTYAISKGVPCDRWPLMTSDCLPHQVCDLEGRARSAARHPGRPGNARHVHRFR